MPQTPSIPQIAADPNFHALPQPEQLKVLQRIDPNFAALPTEEQTKALSGLLAPHTAANPQSSAPASANDSSWFSRAWNAAGNAASNAVGAAERAPYIGQALRAGAGLYESTAKPLVDLSAAAYHHPLDTMRNLSVLGPGGGISGTIARGAWNQALNTIPVYGDTRMAIQAHEAAAGAPTPNEAAARAEEAVIPIFGRGAAEISRGDVARGVGNLAGTAATLGLGSSKPANASALVSDVSRIDNPTLTMMARGLARTGMNLDDVGSYITRMFDSAATDVGRQIEPALTRMKQTLADDHGALAMADAKAGGVSIDLTTPRTLLKNAQLRLAKAGEPTTLADRALGWLDSIKNANGSLVGSANFTDASEIRGALGRLVDEAKDASSLEKGAINESYRQMTRSMEQRFATLDESERFARFQELSRNLHSNAGDAMHALLNGDGRTLAQMLTGKAGAKLTGAKLNEIVDGLAKYTDDPEAFKESLQPVIGNAKRIVNFARSNGMGSFLERYQLQAAGVPRAAAWLGLPLLKRASAAASGRALEDVLPAESIESATRPAFAAPAESPGSTIASRIDQIRAAQQNRSLVGRVAEPLNRAEQIARRPRNLARLAIAARANQQR